MLYLSEVSLANFDHLLLADFATLVVFLAFDLVMKTVSGVFVHEQLALFPLIGRPFSSPRRYQFVSYLVTQYHRLPQAARVVVCRARQGVFVQSEDYCQLFCSAYVGVEGSALVEKLVLVEDSCACELSIP